MSNLRPGDTVEYAVRYAKGRKTFPRLEGTDPDTCARAFAEAQRIPEGGWAEIALVTTSIVEKRR